MELKPGEKYLRLKYPEVMFPKKDKNGRTYFVGSLIAFVQEKKANKEVQEEKVEGDL